MIFQRFIVLTHGLLNIGDAPDCLGYVWVIRAEDFQLDIEALLLHGQGFLCLTLIIEHISDAA